MCVKNLRKAVTWKCRVSLLSKVHRAWHLVLANVVSESSLDAIIGLKVDVQPVCMWLCGLQDRRWSWKDRTCFACTVTRSMPSTPATSTNQWSTEVNSDVHIIHTPANWPTSVSLSVILRFRWGLRGETWFVAQSHAADYLVVSWSVGVPLISFCIANEKGKVDNEHPFFIFHGQWKMKNGG